MRGIRATSIATVVIAGLASVLLVAAYRIPDRPETHITPAHSTHASLPLMPARASIDDRFFTSAHLWSSTGPSFEDVHQSEIGDCYFDAAMAALAHAQPSRIMNAISFDPNTKDFFVRLYDYTEGRDYLPGTHGDGNPWPLPAKVTPLTFVVTQSDLRDDIDFGGASRLDDENSGYIWPAVLEAAYAKLLAASYSSHSEIGVGESPVISGLRISEATNPTNPLWAGGDVDQGMATLTGVPGTYVAASLENYQVLRDALADNRPVTMGSSSSWEDFGDGLVLNHQYTVLGIAKDHLSSQIFLTVRNPWGSNKGVPEVINTDTGILTINLNQAIADQVIGSFDIGPLQAQTSAPLMPLR